MNIIEESADFHGYWIRGEHDSREIVNDHIKRDDAPTEESDHDARTVSKFTVLREKVQHHQSDDEELHVDTREEGRTAAL